MQKTHRAVCVQLVRLLCKRLAPVTGTSQVWLWSWLWWAMAHLEAFSIQTLLNVVQLPKQPPRKLIHQRCQGLYLHSAKKTQSVN